MKHIICYDISEDKIRSRVAKYLESVALRLQESVFLMEASEVKAGAAKTKLLALAAEAKEPRLLIVPICNACAEKIWQHGKPMEEDHRCIVI